MVRYKTIIKIIDSYVTKCPTIAEMKDKLSQMSYEDQFEQLKEQGLLNPLEIEDYEESLKLMTKYDGAKDNLNEKEQGLLLEMYENRIKEKQDTLFSYGRRLFEGLKRNEPPVVDKSKYATDKQYDDMEDLSNKETIGVLEKAQIEDQKIHYDVDSVGKDVYTVLNNYYSGSLTELNREIHNKQYIERLDQEEKKSVQDLDDAIGMSGGLLQDTVLYHGGVWDVHLNVGDHGKFKGYMSASFQKSVGEQFKNFYSDGMTYIIYAPKGTKGVCGNDDSNGNLSNYIEEHEYLLPRNLGFTVLSIDYDTMTAEVLLDG